MKDQCGLKQWHSLVFQMLFAFTRVKAHEILPTRRYQPCALLQEPHWGKEFGFRYA